MNAVEIYWNHRRPTVGHVSIDDQCLLIKRYDAPKWLTRLRRMFGASPAGSVWRNAAGVRQLGIATPLPRHRCCNSGPVGTFATGRLSGDVASAGAGEGQVSALHDIPTARKEMIADRILEAVQCLRAHGYVQI